MDQVPHLSPQALSLLSGQANVIASWQPGAPSQQAMLRAANSGLWTKLTSRVFYAAPDDPGEDQYRWAGALHCGPNAMLSGQAALACHGWKGERAGAIDVLVHASAKARSLPAWLRLRRTRFMPRAAKGGIPRARPQAATVHAAAWARTDREAEFIIISVLQQRLVTVRDIVNELADLPVIPRRARILTTADEYDHGITSMNELHFARLCRKYGIREPDRQVWRRDGKRRPRRLDVFWDEEGVVVEIDGIGHLDQMVRMDDDFRQNCMVLTGDRIFLRVSTLALRHWPDDFMTQLIAALEQGRAKCGGQ